MLFVLKLILGFLISFACAAQDNSLAGCQTHPDGWNAMHDQDLVLQLDDKQSIELSVKIADEQRERSAGYQWICPEQAHNTAMLFSFDGMIHSAFHMRNVYVPLHILFFNERGQLVDRLRMKPEANTVTKPQYYYPSGPFKYALEMTESFTASQLSNNANLSINLPASKL